MGELVHVRRAVLGGRGKWPLVMIIALVGLALRFWRLGDLPLVRDESYYWLWSQHPAWSYYDNPGAVAWSIRLSTLVGGHTEFGVRWLNALLGGAGVVLLYLVGRTLYASGAGLISAAFLAIAAPYVLVSRFVYTDGMALFLFLLNLGLVLPVLRDGGTGAVKSWWRWVAIGCTWALLLNTKLSIYSYFLALGIGVVLWRRDLLRDRRFQLAVLLAAVGLLPFWLWNMAHDWVGLSWIADHATRGAINAASRLGAIYHIVTYLTPPVLLFCAASLFLWQERMGRWLLLCAGLLLLPVLLSPANSPRNLLLGIVPLTILAGAWLARDLQCRHGKQALLVLMLGTTFVFGLGTALNSVAPSPVPATSVVQAIRSDAVGSRALAERIRDEQGLVFTVDYSLASQLWFYSGRPVYTHWGQYLVWGIPDFDRATVINLPHVPPERVGAQVARAFRHVEGPIAYELTEHGLTRRVYVWRARELLVSKAEFLSSLDLMTLYRADQPEMEGSMGVSSGAEQ